MVEIPDFSLVELQDAVAELASHIYAGTCRWLELVGELDRRGSWAESGSGSCAEWLAWRCAISPRAAREHVRVARRLGELSLVRTAFARGEVSYAKVRALTRVAGEATEEELLELARELTAAQLDRAVRALRRVTTADAEDLHAAAYVGYYWDDDGSLCFQGRLAPEDGALLLRALEAGRDTLRERMDQHEPERWERLERGPAGPQDPVYRPSNADALVAVADAALSGTQRRGAERYQVVVHADMEALSEREAGGCSLDDGPAVAPETARRLACDSSVVSAGRKTRIVPAALRRALQTRDRSCRFPGCENRRFVDAHHVEHWALGGETSLENLILLCRRHHRLVHEGGYSVVPRADESFVFQDPWNDRVPDAPRPPPGAADRLVADNRLLGIDAGTCAGGDGDPVDLDLLVAALAR